MNNNQKPTAILAGFFLLMVLILIIFASLFSKPSEQKDQQTPTMPYVEMCIKSSDKNMSYCQKIDKKDFCETSIIGGNNAKK